MGSLLYACIGHECIMLDPSPFCPLSGQRVGKDSVEQGGAECAGGSPFCPQGARAKDSAGSTRGPARGRRDEG